MSSKLKKSLIACFFLSQGLFLLAQDYDAGEPAQEAQGDAVPAAYDQDALALETQDETEPVVEAQYDGAAHDWDRWAQEIRDQAERFNWAQHDDDADDDDDADNWGVWAWEVQEDEGLIPPSRERFAFRNRTFELSLLQTNFRIGNTFIAYRDFFQGPFRILGNLMRADGFADFLDNPSNYYIDNIVINLDDLFNGFLLNFGLNAAPLSININIRDEWGFGLDIAHLSVTGALNLPQNVLNLGDGENLFGVGGAAFMEFGIPVFFHTHGFRVNVRPAAYLPLIHLRPGITYTRSRHRIDVSYDMRVFSAFDLEGMFGDNGDADIMGNIMENPAGFVMNGLGYDISLGVEYPLFPWLSVGVNIVNIPLFPGRLDYYMRLQGNAFFDSSYIDLGGLFDDNGDILDGVFDITTEDASFGANAGRRILRPFTMLFYANYFPVGTPTIVIIPSLGFSINQLHARIASLEGGVSARFDLANILITTFGINYNDRMWRNSFDLALNLRALEIGFGIAMQSPRFVGSFRGQGVGVNFGLKMGW